MCLGKDCRKISASVNFCRYHKIRLFAYSESKLTFHFDVVLLVVVLLVVLGRKVEKDGNAKKGPLY